ncbi:MAG: glycerol acyltransferase [Hyphomonadaceae bacterium]|nr:glycerol acyltransferase [Hyphomonadaceae bacterium]MBC6412556.1 glycerol acyltransferase [Hyphomonadaceae bacterium]
MKYDNPHMSEHSPRMGNGVTRWFGSVGLKLIGWELVGRMPDVPKFVIVGVPHTSNWDAVSASLAMLASGFKYTFLVKKEWFFWSAGSILQALGAYPVDRSKGENVVRQLVRLFESEDRICIGFPPEGTRSKVERYKSGYLRTAYAAGVPVFICAFDGPNKKVTLDRLFPLVGDLQTDNDALKAYVDANYTGVRPERQ